MVVLGECIKELESTVAASSENICCSLAGLVKKWTNSSLSFCNHELVASTYKVHG